MLVASQHNHFPPVPHMDVNRVNGLANAAPISGAPPPSHPLISRPSPVAPALSIPMPNISSPASSSESEGVASVGGTGARASTSENRTRPEVTWLFFKDAQWIPFDYENHAKIESNFTMGGVYVDIKDTNFPDLKCVRVFPTRFYLSYLGMKYRVSAVLQSGP